MYKEPKFVHHIVVAPKQLLTMQDHLQTQCAVDDILIWLSLITIRWAVDIFKECPTEFRETLITNCCDNDNLSPLTCCKHGQHFTWEGAFYIAMTSL